MIGLAASGGQALAQDAPPNVVNRCATDIDGGGLNLTRALARGGRVTFACGGPATIRITQQHALTRSVEIDGGGNVTLDGQDQTPFLLGNASGITVRLANLTVRRMRSTNQAGVIGQPVTASIKVEIASSRILESELPIIASEAKVEDSVLEGNTNAALSVSNVTVIRSKLRSNKAIPILSRGGRVEIVDSEFDGNGTPSVFRGCDRASVVRTSFVNNAGAFTAACPTTVENAAFTGNKAQSGGAIRVSGAARVTIRGSRFIGNAASGAGGAISVEAAGTERVLVLQHTTFKENTAPDGGAVAFDDPTAAAPGPARLQAIGVTFSGNRASDRGGAIVGRNVVLDVRRALFVRNEAPSGAAVWNDTAANRPSALANSLLVLNKGASGTLVGRFARLANSTVVGNEGPGLVALPALAGVPASSLRLTNTIIENNSGGNCRADEPTAFVDEGANLQFPGTSCGGRITVAASLLDTFYSPLLGSPARARGNDDVCGAAPVQRVDFYGKRRPQADHCSIGAVEGDLEQLVRSVKAIEATPSECRDDGSSGPGGRRSRDCAPPRRESECPGHETPVTSRPVSLPVGSGSDPFPPAKVVLPALLAGGINTSDEGVPDFLNNPEFTPYPAIADALLRLTQARPLRCLVPIDVIVFFYEHTPQVKSPRRRSDVNVELLRKNVVDSYNDQFGTTHTRFESLLR